MSKAMKKSKASAQALVDALTKIEAGLDLGASLSNDERSKLRKKQDQMPDAFIEQVANLAMQHGGDVAGIAFDVDAAQTTLTRSRGARAVADVCRRLAQRVEDDAIPQRIIVAKRAMAVYTALRRLVGTPEGNPLMASFEDLAALARRHRKSGRAKASPPAIVPATEPKPTATAASSPSTAIAATPHA